MHIICHANCLPLFELGTVPNFPGRAYCSCIVMPPLLTAGSSSHCLITAAGATEHRQNSPAVCHATSDPNRRPLFPIVGDALIKTLRKAESAVVVAWRPLCIAFGWKPRASLTDTEPAARERAYMTSNLGLGLLEFSEYQEDWAR